MANSKMQNEWMQFRVIHPVFLKIGWSGGTPSILFNPENENVTLTDNGAGDITLTFANPSVAPLFVVGHMLEVADANTLSLECNIDGAPTTSVLKIVLNSGADGATETDAVALHLTVGKIQNG